jgi:uncharacterized protein with PIN domain
MLGSLARWLRIGGYDTEYVKDTSDDSLLDQSESQERILVTRDEVLANRARKRGLRYILLGSGSDEDALAKIESELKITYDPTFSRCPKCNGVLKSIPKGEVEGKIPEGTYRAVDEYWQCERCGSFYWRGSHWPRIVETLGGKG